MSPLLRLILGLAPRTFRERHGAEVARVHAERLRRLEDAGALRRAGFRAREGVGLLLLVACLRLEGGRGPRGTMTGGGSMLERIRQDLAHALRTLRRNPAYAAAAVGILALGIGADTAIFSAANAFLFRPLPFADPDRLVVMYETNPEFGWTADDPTQAAPANVLDWRERVGAFQDVALWESFTDDVTWVRDGEPVLLRTVGVSGNFFDVLGVAPALGRGFRWEETWEGRDRVAVLSHGAWIREFGGDPGAVGRTLDLGGAYVAVVGVMPEGFGFPSGDVDLWLPLGWDPADREAVSFRRAHYVWPVARLGPGETRESADAQLQAVVRSLQEAYPGTNRTMGAGMLPLRDFLVRDVKAQLWLLLGAGGLLLLLACVNVGNLALVRGGERRREVALRFALGADRLRVAVLVGAESAVLAAAGGAVGLALGWLGVQGIGRLTELGIDGVTSVALDRRVVLFAGVASVASGLLFGLIPALRVARGDVQQDLNEEGRAGTSGSRQRGARALVAAEVALALLLVTGAGLMVRTSRALRSVDPGFTPAGVLAFRVTAPSGRYPERADVLSFWDRTLEGLEARPGILAAGTVARLPLDGLNYTSSVAVEGRGPEGGGVEIVHRRADAGYFRALRTPVLRGRSFDATDRPDGPLVVVVNETFAREIFPGQDPIGRRIAYDRVPTGESTWYEIVGVVADQRQQSPGISPRAEVFEDRSQDWWRTMWVVVRTDGAASGALPTVRVVLHDLDPLIPLETVRPLREVWRSSMAREDLVLTLLGSYAVLALLLAAAGVFAVTLQAARRRTREIGVRMALGAARHDVVRLMLRQGLLAVGAGVLLGLLASLAAGRLLGSLLYGVEPDDPATLGAVAGLLLVVATVACWVPARRATRIDPVRALRE